MSEEPPAEEPVLRCHVVARTTEELRAFIDEVGPDVGCRAVARPSGEGVGIDLYLKQGQLDRARSARSAPAVTIMPVENVTENWTARKGEVGHGDRYASRGAVPHGLGRKE
ncbi:hypothetical protein LRS74_32345 [Streptomyces sp. LX-29]|uniref:hypothetical protein n=1 Tax=Streptomyces sp. LX-29 TaxID=2900152 RepID=UPI00240D057D|nr:hypothetical protein [Streptomyces sp. LX-29]WFB11205.1 hypothetical protein LRS74_32345 [Streptomyces sp. LX-29]